MSSYEFAEWLVYYRMEPFGDERADMRAGIIASTVANTARDPKKRRKPYQPKDFMVEYGRRVVHRDSRQLLQYVEVLNKAFKGKDLRHGNASDASS